MDLLKRIELIIEPPLTEKGYAIVRIQLTGMVRRVLQIMIERLDNVSITVEDCTTVSRLVSVLLDHHDPIEGKYSLEISSAGLDRPLVKLVDYQKYCGHQIALKSHVIIDGRKNFTGFLESATENEVTLVIGESDDKTPLKAVIPFNDIRSAKLHINFDAH